MGLHPNSPLGQVDPAHIRKRAPPWILPQLKDSSGDDVREGVGVSASETHEMSGSRGSANFVMKWAKDARHEASLSVMQIKGVTRAFTAEDAGNFVPVVAFECRGLEPVGWTPEVGSRYPERERVREEMSGPCCTSSGRGCPFRGMFARSKHALPRHAAILGSPAGHIHRRGQERLHLAGRGPQQPGVGGIR